MITYLEFCDRIRFKERFVFDGESLDFLRFLSSAARSRLVAPSESGELYRAQVNKWDDIAEVIPDCDPVPVTLPEDRMLPKAELVGDNRLSPKGIAYLYAANSAEIAIAEVRPYQGAYVTVAKLETATDASVVDLIWKEGDDGVWGEISFQMSIPTSPSDSWISYLPTQCVAAFLRKEGFRGVKYQSTMKPGGYNVALFNTADVRITNRHLYNIQSVSYAAKRETDPRREV